MLVQILECLGVGDLKDIGHGLPGKISYRQKGQDAPVAVHGRLETERQTLITVFTQCRPYSAGLLPGDSILQNAPFGNRSIQGIPIIHEPIDIVRALACLDFLDHLAFQDDELGLFAEPLAELPDDGVHRDADFH